MDTIRARCRKRRYDAVVVGSGPNGFAAAITLIRAGLSVLLVEGASSVGGGMRSAELTLPGFVHDVCSAVHPLGIASPFFRSLDLAVHGLTWRYPVIQFAHPLDACPPALVYRSLAATASGLGSDADSYRRLLEPLVARHDDLVQDVLGPLRVPRHPITMARFGQHALRSAWSLSRHRVDGERARAIFAGTAAHAQLPLTYPTTGATALLLTVLAHVGGWPVALRGSQAIAEALRSYFESLGGECVVDATVGSLRDLPPSRLIMLDVSARQLNRLGRDRLPNYYRRQLDHFRTGPGTFKVDYALNGPIPWRDAAIAAAGTVHLGGALAEVAEAEAAVAGGRHPDRPFVLLAQQSSVDPSRAPPGKHTGWAYCHVPYGSTVDMTVPLERQIERFAPGFRDLVLARHVSRSADLAHYNPNYDGGDISGGAMIISQLYTRPAIRLDPYSTPARGIYLCSSSTPPGGGVHGMCGYWAARSALTGWAG